MIRACEFGRAVVTVEEAWFISCGIVGRAHLIRGVTLDEPASLIVVTVEEDRLISLVTLDEPAPLF